MIGFYDYTVVLTYLSLLSASTGIVMCLRGVGHPFIGLFFLLFCGLCDAFDGKVARSKKDRSATENAFGIQIDSLSDLVAFGLLPACIGLAMIRTNQAIADAPHLVLSGPGDKRILYPVLFYVVVLVYILAAMIRLAYFNVMEEERQKTETTVRKTYVGLPVTSASLIFPTVLLIEFITKWDMSIVYFAVMLVVALLFVLKINIRKPGMKGIWIMIAIGAIEFVALILVKTLFK